MMIDKADIERFDEMSNRDKYYQLYDAYKLILINGHDKNSKALMQLVLSERDRLRDTLTKKIAELNKHGTTQLRPDLVAKELAEVSTMRARGAHFAPLKKKTLVYEDTPKNVKVDLNDYLFLTDDGGEDK